MAEGVRRRHSKGCNAHQGKRCNCKAGWEASVFSTRDEKKIRKTFAREGEAKSWRAEAKRALDTGVLRAPKPTTVEQAWDAWFAGAKTGAIRNRSGDPFKPSALRSYKGSMKNHVLPRFGSVRLSDLRRPDLQAFADSLHAEGLSPSSMQTILLPLRAIVRRAINRGDLEMNPCSGLELPAVRGRRERFASPAEAEALIAALPEFNRAIWATAMYAGLRLGELRALQVEHVDFDEAVIHVRYGWDPVEGVIALKSDAGRRKVPLISSLRDLLVAQIARTGAAGDDLIFGQSARLPFTTNRNQFRADDAWENANFKERKLAAQEGRDPIVLERITLHSCRHTFASLMIAAGVNAKALSTFMGHANISITLDRYGHLMPGSEAEAADLLDAYLAAQRATASATAMPDERVTGAPAGAPQHVAA